MSKPPLILAERAKEILGAVGHSPGTDFAYGFFPANFLGYAGRHPEIVTPEQFASGSPAALHFWFRGSPTVMIPRDGSDRVSQDDPVFNISGMSLVVLDPDGRLVRMAQIPPQSDPGWTPQSADFKPLFDASGLAMNTYTPVAPEWTPTMYADTRAAWSGPVPGLPSLTQKIEACSYRGKPVCFHTVSPWTTTSRMAATIDARRRVSFMSALVQITVLAMFVAAGLIARHNWRKGRGDRRGAAQLFAFLMLAAAGVWLIQNKHVADPTREMTRFFLSLPFWAAGLFWVIYLAVEPYVRRFWPSTLVSWSRLMARQWHDPLVGRDVLFGVALGLALSALASGTTYLGSRLGHPLSPTVPDLEQLLGPSIVVARVLNQIFNAVLNAIFAVFALVLLKMVVKREWLASVVAIALAMIMAVRSGGGSAVVNYTAALAMVTLIVLTIQRLGLVATTVMFFVYFVMSSAVITLDTTRWFFSSSVVLLLIPASLAFYGFYASRGGEPIFGSTLLD
jgi:hypothetical protein